MSSFWKDLNSRARAEALFSDIRFAFRSIHRRPGFSLISIVVLGIGIGAVTVMFTTLNAVVLRPLPFHEPHRLAWCWGTTESRSANSISAMDYFDYRERNDVFVSLDAHLVFTPGRIVTGEGDPERVSSTLVSRDTYLIVSMMLAFVALAACVLPALRAMKRDPVTALRNE